MGRGFLLATLAFLALRPIAVAQRIRLTVPLLGSIPGSP